MEGIIKIIIGCLVICYCYGKLPEGSLKFQDISANKTKTYSFWNLIHQAKEGASENSLEQLRPNVIPTDTSFSAANYVDGLTYNYLKPIFKEPRKYLSENDSTLMAHRLIQPLSRMRLFTTLKTTSVPPVSMSTSSKSPLEYKPQNPSFASPFSSGQLDQLVPPGKPWPADTPATNPVFEDRFKEPTSVSPASMSTSSKSPLEYKPQGSSFASLLSSGQLGQLVPPGKPWPADAPATSPVFEDRFKEPTSMPPVSMSTSSKSPLEYKPQKPSFASPFSSGQLDQLVPPGKPWPADTPATNPEFEDRFKEPTSVSLASMSTSSKSPLEYKPQGSSFASLLSSGQLGQLVPPGKPWPADAPATSPVFEDRFKEPTSVPPVSMSTSSKSPLEYKPQKPSFASPFSSGQLDQLVPPGKPWPADTPATNPEFEDRFKEPTSVSLASMSTSSKSPLEYKPQGSSFASLLSSGQLGPLVPPGKPWPADAPATSPVFEDRFKEPTSVPPVSMSTSSKSPLEYKPQGSSFASLLSSGQLGQLVPPGKPWPSDTPAVSPVFEDRFKETTSIPLVSMPISSKSPLEYKPQRPSFASPLSSGQLGQLVPPGKPWPADGPATSPVFEDRLKEPTSVPPVSLSTSSKSPLEYNPQRPSSTSHLSSGQLGQLLPPGKPGSLDAPAASLVEDRFKETTAVSPVSKNPL